MTYDKIKHNEAIRLYIAFADDSLRTPGYTEPTAFDIRDRVNGSVMDDFEIFPNRMIPCRKAAETLDLQCNLMINEQQLI